MKKFALALMASAALLFGFSVAAQAAYPPGITVTVSPAGNLPPGVPFTITIPCFPGAGPVTFTITGPNFSVSVVSTCGTSDSVTGSVMGFIAQTASGTASATLTAPTAPGTYQGSAVQVGGSSADFTIVVAQATTTTAAPGAPTTVAPVTPTVPSTGLPATGSGGLGVTTGIAIGLLAVGAGLFVVAQVRRRDDGRAPVT